jgi:AcrR family transcriptional regulator
MQDRQSTRDRILSAALAIIAEQGAQSLRTREVARRAGVTLSAVHYHYQNKANLVRMAYEYLSGQMMERYSHMTQASADPKDALFAMLSAMADFFTMFPGFVRSIAHDIVQDGVVDVTNRSALSAGCRGIGQFLANQGVRAEESQFRAVALISALFYPLLLGDEAEPIYGLNFADKPSRDSYIRSLVSIAF